MSKNDRQESDVEIVRKFEKYPEPSCFYDDQYLDELAKMALATKKGRTNGMGAITRSLSHDDPEIRYSALRSLNEHQPNIPVNLLKPLLVLLVDSNASIRWDAQKSLRSIGPRAISALPILKKMLPASDDRRECSNTLRTMCVIAPNNMLVTSTLVGICNDKDGLEANRRCAVIMLGESGRPEKAAIQALMNLSSEPNLRTFAIESLVRLAPEDKKVAALFIEEVRRSSCIDMEFLAQSLLPAKKNERLKYLDVFQHIIDGDDELLGIYAVEPVLQIDRKNERARRALKDAILNGDEERQGAALMLVSENEIRIVEPIVIAKLIEIINTTALLGNQRFATAALGFSSPNDESVLRALESCLGNESTCYPKTAALALVRADQKRQARKAIAKFLRQPSNHYGLAAPGELSLIAKTYSMTDVYVEVLTEMLNSPSHRIKALRELSAIAPETKSASPMLIKLLDDPSAEVRQRALEILGRNGGETAKAIPRIIELQANEDMFVRWQAEDTRSKILEGSKAERNE